MAKVKNYLYKTSLDSFKYRIDLRLVKIIDQNLLDYRIVTTAAGSTGEIIDIQEFKNSALYINFDQYSIKFAINQIMNVDYLVILINSKILEESYLNGISIKNIELIYNKIISCNIIDISFEDFLSLGNISDIDIKKDFELSPEDFKLVISDLQKKTIPNKRKNFGCNTFTGETNLGIEWNDRKKATLKHPFLKLYHKEIEVKHGKNKDYFAEYINSDAVKNVVRCEATAKGLKELKIAGIESSTLISVLKATQEQLDKLIYNAIEFNIEPPLKAQKTKSILSPVETIIFAHITNMIKNQNMTFESSLEFTLNHFQNKQSKHRAKKQIIKVYESKIQGQISEVRQRRLSNFYTQFGWMKNTSI